MKKFSIPFLISLALLLSGQAFAAEQKASSYQFEALIFHYVNSNQWAEELWPANVAVALPQDMVALDQPIEQPTVATPTTQYVLNRETALLKDNPNTQLLAHIAWVEDADALAQPHPIYLSGGYPMETAEDERAWTLEGTITPTLDHYFSIKVELFLRMPPDELSTTLSGDNFIGGQFPVGPVVFELKQHRKMKSNELNYFDHPLLGMIFIIKRIN